jgi:hypothetical protein
MIMGAGVSAAQDDAEAIGSRRELFVDEALVARMDGAELHAHEPRPAGTVMRLDNPWEGGLSGYFTVLEDDGLFRMYYRGLAPQEGVERPGGMELTCYAESRDGTNWVKPELGIYEILGSKANNVILADAKPMTHNFCPFIDEKPGVPASERYKAVGGNQKEGLLAYASADGVQWEKLQEEPIMKGPEFDSQNLVFWSEKEDCYVAYFRTWTEHLRRIARATSPDFLNWSEPKDLAYGEAPMEHLYTNQIAPYFRAPHLYIGLAARFMPGRNPYAAGELPALGLAGPGVYRKLEEACSDAVLLSVREPGQIDRTFPEAVVRPGLDPRNWGARSNYPSLGIVQTAPHEMSVYINRHYGQPSSHLERMTYRLDGFASLHAGHKGGEMVTKPIVFEGSSLEINASTTAAGSVRVELQDADGNVLEGFALDDCTPFLGDRIEHVVQWKGGDLGAVAGKPVRLRFALQEADVFSYRFR